MNDHPRIGAALLAACAGALFAGCASTPPVPPEKLALAENAIQRAERAGAAQTANAELLLARDKLVRAQSIAADDGEEATRLAEQAEADATLAEARAEAARALAAQRSVEEGLQVLREEVTRQGLESRQPSPLDAPPAGATPSGLPPAPPPSGAPPRTPPPPAMPPSSTLPQ